MFGNRISFILMIFSFRIAFPFNNVDAMWSNVDVMWNIVEECGCFVDVIWNIVEEYGCFVEKCGCNVDPPHLHISQFDQVLSSPWSVILNYAIVDVMWIHQISTSTIKWTADPFCRLYSSVNLLSVSWSCIWSLDCTRALALLYNINLEALVLCVLLSLLVLYLKTSTLSQKHNFIASNILRLSRELLVSQEE